MSSVAYLEDPYLQGLLGRLPEDRVLELLMVGCVECARAAATERKEGE